MRGYGFNKEFSAYVYHMILTNEYNIHIYDVSVYVDIMLIHDRLKQHPTELPEKKRGFGRHQEFSSSPQEKTRPFFGGLCGG